MGLFADDTRFLSHWVLTVNGAPPLLLSSGKVDYYSATFFLRNPVVGDLGYDEISIKRDRFVGDGMQEHIVVQNHAARPVDFELALDVGSDFADIFAVKAYDFTLGDPDRAAPLPELISPSYEEEDNQFVLGDERARVRESLTAWNLRVPQVRSSWDQLHHSFRQSVGDLASRRMGEDTHVPGQLPAAGMPWFMAVFGRDTLITCLQTLLFGTELARNALVVLAE